MHSDRSTERTSRLQLIELPGTKCISVDKTVVYILDIR